MRASVEACQGKPAIAVTSPTGKHFMPADAELARIGIRVVVYPQEILAATVHAVRSALAGLRGGERASMATVPELAGAIRMADYLALDERLSRPV
jgi:2-methylisocitrate lyase-like PEP mutase family enzyme